MFSQAPGTMMHQQQSQVQQQQGGQLQSQHPNIPSCATTSVQSTQEHPLSQFQASVGGATMMQVGQQGHSQNAQSQVMGQPCAQPPTGASSQSQDRLVQGSPQQQTQPIPGLCQNQNLPASSVTQSQPQQTHSSYGYGGGDWISPTTAQHQQGAQNFPQHYAGEGALSVMAQMAIQARDQTSGQSSEGSYHPPAPPHPPAPHPQPGTTNNTGDGSNSALDEKSIDTNKKNQQLKQVTPV
mmetsp:Transcript_46478/g.68705  ORF Transcript_46478/g.68705 Transcript_46478/m.68705 type:complete len:239 (-) Transcript_46478:225-941(-)